MRSLLLAALLSLPVLSGPAFAEQSCKTSFFQSISSESFTLEDTVNRLHMCQFSEGHQSVDQSIRPDVGDQGGAEQTALPSGPTSISQFGANVSNLIDYDSEIGSVLQFFNGQQEVSNVIDAGAFSNLGTLSQEGTNSANVAKGGTIELALQVMGEDASQILTNVAKAAGVIGDVSQTGLNLANMAEAVHAIGVGYQDIRSGATQEVTNIFDLGRGSQIANGIVQSGTNIGNVLIAEKVDKVIRRFDGNQVVSNTVILNDGYRPRINQTGNNIANFISAKEVGTIYQVSTGSQTVLNTVVDAEGNEVRHANFEQTETNYMGASNVVNLMIIEPSRSGGSNEDVAITQEADFDQTASGSSGQSQSGNVLVINR